VSFWTLSLLIANLALVAIVIALPLGLRTTRQVRVIKAPAERIWEALFPLGENAGFDGEIVGVRRTAQNSAWLSFSWRGRDDRPIERLAVFEDVRPQEHFAMRFADDTSLDLSFWKHFRERVSLAPAMDDAEATRVTIEQVDSYRGAAFLLFRHFALRRKMRRLAAWIETGKVPSGGLVFEHPLTQFGLAALSALLIWPLFGLTKAGLAAAILLTSVIAIHELGHVAAFRIVGHRSARMIFIPLLGGIAIGGRPYDKKFEVAFVALMGPGFSAFLVGLAMAGTYLAAAQGSKRMALLSATIAGALALFNLANLLPVWRFDGAQVLRQITGHWQTRVLAELTLLLPFIAVGLALGSTGAVVAGFAAATIGMAVLTRNAVFKPRQPLKPMSQPETIVACAGLAAVVAVHAIGVTWAAERLF
jgi:Zn-dependent protease